jgi:hypothetical protein
VAENIFKIEGKNPFGFKHSYTKISKFGHIVPSLGTNPVAKPAPTEVPQTVCQNNEKANKHS